ncbi:RNA-directed DNA polymerase, eukaryota, reverse transcriptase zinc-binding domain protein [Tanacetum coccineum]
MEEGKGDIEDVFDVNSGIAKDLSLEEVKAAAIAFGNWDWVSNSTHSTSGCRIMVGWDKSKVDIMVIHMTRQDDLRRAKSTFRGFPWILMGDFNVTLKLEEHSARGSKVNGEMLEFRECLNDIEVEDSKWSGLFYTWIKSPSKPETSILKKLDRVLVNAEFINKYGDAFTRFLPFLISDHSPYKSLHSYRSNHKYSLSLSSEK